MPVSARAPRSHSRSQRACGGSTDCLSMCEAMPSGSSRGARSGVGIGLFDHGGLVVDGGRGPLDDGRADRQPNAVPGATGASWSCLIRTDKGCTGRTSVKCSASSRRLRMGSGPSLPAGPDEGAARARGMRHCRLRFSDQRNADAPWRLFRRDSGRKPLFQPRCGGRPLAALEDEGADGIGQSSWGPTGFAFAPSAEEANRLVESIRRQPRCRDLDIRTVAVSIAERISSVTLEADEPERHQR